MFGIIPQSNAVVDTPKVASQDGIDENLLHPICALEVVNYSSSASKCVGAAGNKGCEVWQFEQINPFAMLHCLIVLGVGMSFPPRLLWRSMKHQCPGLIFAANVATSLALCIQISVLPSSSRCR